MAEADYRENAGVIATDDALTVADLLDKIVQRGRVSQFEEAMDDREIAALKNVAKALREHDTIDIDDDPDNPLP